MNHERNNQSNKTYLPIVSRMELAKQLKILLQENDITVAQIARKAGVSAKTIYNWLAGQHPKDIAAVKKVADQLNVSLDYICYGIDNHKKTTQFEQHLDEINAGIFEVVLRKVKVKRGKS